MHVPQRERDQTKSDGLARADEYKSRVQNDIDTCFPVPTHQILMRLARQYQALCKSWT